MTLQDYELLITTMEEIASLDRNVKDLEDHSCKYSDWEG
jgi:hypothetical protein